MQCRNARACRLDDRRRAVDRNGRQPGPDERTECVTVSDAAAVGFRSRQRFRRRRQGPGNRPEIRHAGHRRLGPAVRHSATHAVRPTATRSSRRCSESMRLYMFSRSDIRPFVSVGIGGQHDKRSLFASAPRRHLALPERRAWRCNGCSPKRRLAGRFPPGRRLDQQGYLGLQARRQQLFRPRADVDVRRAARDAGTVAGMPPPPVLTPPPPPPPRPTTPPPPPPPPPPQRMTLEASSLFALNSARVTPPQPELDAFASALQGNPQINEVVITGHTDQLGTPSINARLSKGARRSRQVVSGGKGIAANRLTARGVGSSQLVTNCQLPTRAEMIQCGTQNDASISNRSP